MSELTPENAPTDVNELEALAPAKRWSLALRLQMLKDPADKKSWMGTPAGDQAQALSVRLIEYQKAVAGGASPVDAAAAIARAQPAPSFTPAEAPAPSLITPGTVLNAPMAASALAAPPSPLPVAPPPAPAPATTAAPAVAVTEPGRGPDLTELARRTNSLEKTFKSSIDKLTRAISEQNASLAQLIGLLNEQANGVKNEEVMAAFLFSVKLLYSQHTSEAITEALMAADSSVTELLPTLQMLSKSAVESGNDKG